MVEIAYSQTCEDCGIGFSGASSSPIPAKCDSCFEDAEILASEGFLEVVEKILEAVENVDFDIEKVEKVNFFDE